MEENAEGYVLNAKNIENLLIMCLKNRLIKIKHKIY